MKTIRFFSVAAALFLMGSYTMAVAGSCNFVTENMFAGPFNTCQDPVDEAGCETLGTTDDNRDAVYSDDACTTEGLVGTCDLGDSQIHYLDGDSSGLAIGCGFQGGDWTTAE